MSLWDKKLIFDDCIYQMVNYLKLTRWIFLDWRKKMVGGNVSFKNITLKDTCVVLGNGPSLSDEDFSKFATHDVVACNFFYRHPKAALCKPRYYFIIDPKLERGDWPASMIEEMYRACAPELLFLSVEARKNPMVLQAVAGKQVCWLDISLTLNGFYDFFGGLHKPMAADNVTKAAIQAVVYMGYKEIYVLGVDGDGLFRDLLGEQAHFYKGEIVNENETFQHMVKNLWFCTEGFRTWGIMADRLRAGNINIYNASRCGLLNCLERRALPVLDGE